jgi:hypothetical protein
MSLVAGSIAGAHHLAAVVVAEEEVAPVRRGTWLLS